MPDAAEVLRDARRLVVLSGAGLSTESGIPDFRSPGGIWTRFDPDEFRYDRFLADPDGFWAAREKLMAALDLPRARPNPAHDALARASRSERYRGHVTQNIDGLLDVAGHAAPKLVEIHGSARKVRCIACLRFFPHGADDGTARRCPECGGRLKPGSVLFGEPMPERELAQAEAWAREADAMLVVGSRLEVWPAAGLPDLALARGARLVIVNRDPTRLDEDADAVVHAPLGDALPGILAAAGFLRP